MASPREGLVLGGKPGGNANQGITILGKVAGYGELSRELAGCVCRLFPVFQNFATDLAHEIREASKSGGTNLSDV
jgi:hypothetical protein